MGSISRLVISICSACNWYSGYFAMPFGRDQHAIMIDSDGRHAMKLSRAATMKALDGLTVGVEPRHQTIGTGWRPRLLNTKFFDPPYLRWLAIVERTPKCRADPEVRRDICHHARAELALAQNELGELGAQRKE